jgi:hypothetical protein
MNDQMRYFAKKSEYLMQYCGVWPDWAELLVSIFNEQPAQQVASAVSCRRHGLINHDSLELTQLGHSVARRCQPILAGTFFPPVCIFIGDDELMRRLASLQTRDLGRNMEIKNMGLKSLHRKLLLSVTRVPGQAQYALKLPFGDAGIEFVADLGLITRPPVRFSQVWLTKAGEHLMRSLLTGGEK